MGMQYALVTHSGTGTKITRGHQHGTLAHNCARLQDTKRSNAGTLGHLNPSTQQLFTELKAVYDYIVIDSAPVLVADDTLSLAPLVDTSLFVIRLDRTPARFAEKAIQALDQRQVEVGGAVLNFDQSFTGEYYAYDYAKYYAKFAKT